MRLVNALHEFLCTMNTMMLLYELLILQNNECTVLVPITYPHPTHTHRVTSRRKTNIPLLPRALAKRAVSGDKNTTSGASGEGNKLSNDDFRKLLAKK